MGAGGTGPFLRNFEDPSRSSRTLRLGEQATRAPTREISRTLPVPPAPSAWRAGNGRLPARLGPKPAPTSKGCDYGVAHFAGADLPGTRFVDIRSPQPLRQHRAHGSLDAVCPFLLVKRVAQHHG